MDIQRQKKKKRKFNPYFTLYAKKINSKCITELNAKHPETIKLLEKTQEKICDLSLSKNFLYAFL